VRVGRRTTTRDGGRGGREGRPVTRPREGNLGLGRTRRPNRRCTRGHPSISPIPTRRMSPCARAEPGLVQRFPCVHPCIQAGRQVPPPPNWSMHAPGSLSSLLQAPGLAGDEEEGGVHMHVCVRGAAWRGGAERSGRWKRDDGRGVCRRAAGRTGVELAGLRPLEARRESERICFRWRRSSAPSLALRPTPAALSFSPDRRRPAPMVPEAGELVSQLLGWSSVGPSLTAGHRTELTERPPPARAP